MSKTKIEWADMTINPVVGCSKCSPGCDNCYAEKMAARLAKMPQTAEKYAGVVDECGKWTGIIDFDVYCLTRLPRKPKRIFVGSMCDLFHDSVMDSQLEHLMGHIVLTRANTHHTFILLTKRPERMKEFFTYWKPYHEIKNVWLGVTVCNQQEADEKIPLLLDTPAAKRFVSIEPMLGAVDLTAMRFTHSDGFFGDALQWHHLPHCRRAELQDGAVYPALDWVICGGETGLKARPMHPDWVRSLRDQCAAAGTPFFFKGWGEWAERHALQCNEHGVQGKIWHNFDPDTSVCRVGKRSAGRLLDGCEWRD